MENTDSVKQNEKIKKWKNSKILIQNGRWLGNVMHAIGLDLLLELSDLRKNFCFI